MNNLQIKYVGDAHYRTQKMFEEIKNQIYRKGYDVCIFGVRDNEEIVVEVIAHSEDDKLELEIEWRETSPYTSIESSLVNFSNDEEIISALDYIRQCAEDGR